MTVRKDGPKRLRRTRRDLPYGQVSLWGRCHHMRQERERRMDRATMRAERRQERAERA